MGRCYFIAAFTAVFLQGLPLLAQADHLQATHRIIESRASAVDNQTEITVQVTLHNHNARHLTSISLNIADPHFVDSKDNTRLDIGNLEGGGEDVITGTFKSILPVGYSLQGLSLMFVAEAVGYNGEKMHFPVLSQEVVQ